MPLELELCPGRWVGGQHPCFIIAEIGQNHQGDLEVAKRMIRTAKECGADCAKFQKSELEFKFNRKALERPYTSKHSWGKTYGEHKRHLEFSHAQYRELQRFAQEVGIFFTASGMDEMAVEFLHELNVPFFKVGSGDTNNFPYLEKTARKGRPMVISSGMQSMDTMKQVYQIVKPLNPNFCFLQCTSAYPLQPEDANLRVISTPLPPPRPRHSHTCSICGQGVLPAQTRDDHGVNFLPWHPALRPAVLKPHSPGLSRLHLALKPTQEYQKLFPDIPIGYSGHETGIAISVAAVALGAKVLERHITLDKTWKGSDHSASLEPGELAELVRSVRLVERALGSPTKQLLPCEMACNEKLGKSVVAKVRIPEGTVLTLDMLTVKVGEPKGCAPEDIFTLVGKKVLVTIEEDDTILEEAVENHGKKIKS
uniref:N-acetylneuraminate-9-phosphate synthase n=1 Tax=Oryctolagus cuniculus TaxID=9986 RepID=G1TLY5_RABIT